MIYIRMELWPRGQKDKAVILHEGCIYNTGEGTKTRGTYRAYFSRRGGFGKKSDLPREQMTGVLKKTHLEGFKRKAFSAWKLLAQILPDEWKDV